MPARKAVKAPTSLTLRSFQVGFGDCFLLSFNYGESAAAERRHVLIDFGSTARPKNAPTPLQVAQEIARLCKPRLDAVVASHRHRDHISGFGGASGKVIAGLKPSLVLQPWTEHPRAAKGANAPPSVRLEARNHLQALGDMHKVARHTLQELTSLRASKTVREQLAFLGQDNLANLAAVKTLMDMRCPHVYAHYGQPSGLEPLLPGVKVRVLGPPTLDQSRSIRKQRSEDEAEFWHLQAAATQRSATPSRKLFPRARRVTGSVLPLETRWFLPRVEAIRGDQLLEIVRILDKQMNNTSLILLFEVGSKRFLFSGDAQLENWMYALKEAKDAKENKALLAGVDLYKVGHHGSLNATPKTLWKLFRKKGAAGKKGRLRTVISTMSNKHGHADRDTEVPRQTLVTELTTLTDLVSTQTLRKKTELFHEIHIPV